MNTDKILFNSHIGYIFIKSKEICFCKADDYRTIVKLIDGNIYNVNLTLSEVVNKVNNKYLIRCHRSYAINLDFLHSIKHDLSFVKLESDDEIPISVRKRRVIKKKLIELGFI